MQKITIVGAGLSGMVSAINLAKKGYEVTVLEKEKEYTISVTVGTTNAEYIKVFIDYNDDGDFDDADENIFTSDKAEGTHSGTFTTPTNPLVYNKLLRTRVISGWYSITDACQERTYGQAEDYSVVFLSSLAFESAVTNTDGSQIEISFNKAMADPTGKHILCL